MFTEKIMIFISVLFVHLINTSQLLSVNIWLKPDLMILLIVFFSLKKGTIYGIWVGFLGGLLADISLGGEITNFNEVAYKIGLHSLIFSILGYLSRKLVYSTYKESFMIIMVYIFILTCITRSFIFYLYIYLYNENLSYQILSTSFYNALIAPMFFYISSFLYKIESEKINEQE